jgi:hypothetical protein
LAGLLGVVQEGPSSQEPHKPVVEVPPAAVDKPLPRFPAGDGFSLRTIFLRPRWEMTTREFDINKFSGDMNFGDIADFERTTMAMEGRVDLGPWMFSATLIRQRRRTVLTEDMTFEQHTFAAGTIVEGEAYFGTIEGFYGLDLAGGPAETFQISLLFGITYAKLRMGIEGDNREGSEGFSALWPVPALGFEGRVSLSDRVALALSARGTRLRFENPFQIDAGGPQDIKFLYGRIDASLKFAVSDVISLETGYTGLDAFINNSSSEDTDTADLKAGGVHLSVTLGF